MDLEQIVELVSSFAYTYGLKLVGAIIVYIVGSIVVSGISGAFVKYMNKKEFDDSLKPFLASLFKTLLRVLLIISVLSMLGIEMTSFIAILGAAGLAVGMALSGTLQNFAGGVMILVFRPFKVGDVIEAQGYIGSVSEIQIFNSILKTPDNKTIIIPNGALSNSSMVNYSTEAQRRVDWTFGIGYGDNTEKAKSILNELCSNDSRILKDPEVFIALSELADSSVNFVVRAWVNAEDYWGVFFDMNQNVYNRFNAEGINIPYPQMEVTVKKD